MANDFDRKGRYRGKVRRQWETVRRKVMRESGRERGLSGAALESAVLAMAASDPSLVKIERAGA